MDNSVLGSAEKLKQLKQLLDIGAITQEEFEYKKEALLNPDKEEKYLKSLELIKQNDENSLSNAVMLLNSIGNLHNAEELLIEITERAEAVKKESIYKRAVEYMTAEVIETVESQQKAIEEFSKILDYKDSVDGIEKAKEKICLINKREEEKRIREEKFAEERRIETEKNAMKAKMICAILAVITIIAIVLGVVYVKVIQPQQKLNTAMTYLDSGNYENAYALLEELGDNEAIAKSKYDRAVELINKKNIEEAYLLLEDIDYKDSNEKLSSITPQYKKIKLSKAKVGGNVLFGSYKEMIEWKVLDKKDDMVLIITKKIIECKPYNTEDTDVTWEKCTLRKWLNNDFYKEAFSDEEKNLIQTTNVVNKDNTSYNIKSGNNTKDKVFLLSVDEANQYFISDSERESNKNKVDWWWLRSPGKSQSYAAHIGSSGNVSDVGSKVGEAYFGVRPAMWISLE